MILNILLYALLIICLFICAIVMYFALIWIYLLAASLFVSMKKEYKKPSRFWYKNYILAIKTICLQCKVHIHADGLEKLPENTHFMFVSNHRSNFDNIVQGVVLKKEHIAFVSKPENFKIPLARKYIWRNMFLPIERNNVRESAKTIIKAVNYLKDDYFSIGIFPEGTRSKDCTLLPFKPGCFKIAEKSGHPIVVCAIKGTENIHKNFPWKKTDVYCSIVEVISPEQIKTMNTIEISDRVRNLINAKLEAN
ncbi:MAG: 1-acyl-sn-glycerol-3-phosphate acyltransferase [Treponema sp.]|nr:1-acyl-sn-glycerol-3-phosphate acyltransferase [Spirochaetia bacterium]MDY2839384.1 1-acyl-sn-glycerol-3-phosphate acyltransferase [Treponema sp.]MDY5122887.1 1-acyl-sn-glycerol-3-phosphate acyltransferase [Treponema sp.]